MKIYISEISYNKNFEDFDKNLVKVHFKKMLEQKISSIKGVKKPVFTKNIVKTIRDEKPDDKDVIITFDDIFDWKNVEKYGMNIDEILSFWLKQPSIVYPHPKTTYFIESKFYKLHFKDEDIPMTEIYQFSPNEPVEIDWKKLKSDYKKAKQDKIVIKYGNSCCAEKVFIWNLEELDTDKETASIEEFLKLTNSLMIVIIQPYNVLIDIGKREYRVPIINRKPVNYFTLNMGKVADNEVPHIEFDMKNKKHAMIHKVAKYAVDKISKIKEFVIYPLIQLRVDVAYTTDPELIARRVNDDFYLKYESWYTKETVEQLYYINEIELNSASFFFDNYIQTTDKKTYSTMKTQEMLADAYKDFVQKQTIDVYSHFLHSD